MISYRQEIQNSWVQSAPSVRALADLLGMARPYSLRDVITRLRELETREVHTDIVTGAGVPLNGAVRFVVGSDGSYTFSGHMRATGFPSYHYGLQAWIVTTDGTVIAAQRVGDVYGTDTPGDRQDDWSQSGSDLSIRQHWESLRADARLGYDLDADIGGVLGAARDVLEFAAEGIAANIVLGEAGWIILIGSELAGMGVRIGTPDILTGLLVAGGTLLILGPYGLIPAVIAGGAAASLVNVRHRTMTNAEIAFADRVFNGTIDYDRVTLTNMSHGGGRKFTIPSVGGSILVNLDDALDNPTTYTDTPDSDYSQPGSVFIHELTHAWQITNNSFLGMVCGMSSNYSYHAGASEGDRLTDLTWSNRAWGDFNNEQQAHIVDDWYGAHFTDLNGFDAANDPAYHFIRNNIRTGQT